VPLLNRRFRGVLFRTPKECFLADPKAAKDLQATAACAEQGSPGLRVFFFFSFFFLLLYYYCCYYFYIAITIFMIIIFVITTIIDYYYYYHDSLC
jgi:hypothetical protein